MDESFIRINKESWNRKTLAHLDSEFYNNEDFKIHKNSLNEIELALLPSDLSGKKLLHLQCHFGQDSISLAQLGADVTAVDFSDVSIREARKLAAECEIEVEFVCCNIYDLQEHLKGEYDIIYTSYGVLGWLEDLRSYSEMVFHFLKPGGIYMLVEFHPVIWMFDDEMHLKYPYSKSKPIIEKESETYTGDSLEREIETISWNHSMSEVMSSLISQGLIIDHFEEYDYSPYNIFPEMTEYDSGRYRIQNLGTILPYIYSLITRKKK